MLPDDEITRVYMRIFLQKEDGFYDLDTCYHVEQASRRHNFFCEREDRLNIRTLSKTELGYNEDHWVGLEPTDVYVGSIEFMRSVFHSLDVKAVPMGIVQDLLPFYDRDIKYSTLGEVRTSLSPSVFVKPYLEKQFTAYVTSPGNNYTESSEVEGLPDDTKVIISPVEDFAAEYRCLVHNGEIVDVRPYVGKWFEKGMQPDVDLIKEAISSWKNAPKAYALDVGVTTEGKTKIVEVNDFWACGCYGFEDTKLVFMTTQRYFEILRKRTTAV
jgi:hypothetical protein